MAKIRAKAKPVTPAPIVDDFTFEDDDLDMDFGEDFGDDFDDMSFDDVPTTSNMTAQEMATRFPTVPLDVCHRAIKACEVSGVPSSYYVDRYCLHLHDTTPMNNDFSEAYLELMKKDRA